MKKLIILFCFIACHMTGYAQDYDHYYIEFHSNGTQYSGVIAIDTRYPRQVLRLAYYQPQSGTYKLIEQRYQTDYMEELNAFYFDNVWLRDRTYCYDAPAHNYSPDYFVFNKHTNQIWVVDELGNLALVHSKFIPLKNIDDWKPYFWPEIYHNGCGTNWQNRIYQFFKESNS